MTSPVIAQELEPQLDLVRLLWGLDHSLRLVSRRMEKQLGLTGPQRFLLRMVQSFPGLGTDELASAFRTHTRNLNGVLSRLERQGLLLRRHDGERVALFLSPSGEAMVAPAVGTVEAAVHRALKRGSSSGEVGAAIRLLSLLTEELSRTDPPLEGLEALEAEDVR